MPFAVTLFGPMQVKADGKPLPPLRSRKALWLLALLTLRSGQPVERGWLAGTLWPEVDQSRAAANLRVVLSELRRALGRQGERLKSSGHHTLSLDLAGADVDVITFDAAMLRQDPKALKTAVALYHGPLLEGCDEEWAPPERAVREQACLQALQLLGDAALAAADWETAAGYYRRAVRMDPWRETAQRGLMSALSDGGNGNGALEAYQAFVRLLRKDDPRSVPDEQTAALYARLRAEARRRSAARTSLLPSAGEAAFPVPAVSLPNPLTGLVGREEECLGVVSRLRRSRLVTLTGPGGIGKTRLALAAAEEAAPEYADGAWLAALETITDGERIAGQIAEVLGLKEAPGRSALACLTDHLRPRRLLLLLDNCEHLLETAAQVAGHLLRECAGVRILATSREALGITGEAAWAVPPLQGGEAVRLFVERAQAVQRTFALSADNEAAVAQICERLEGIPLALELAAARVRAMTVAQIAARLDDHLSLLTSRNRTGLPRQQTLRATLDWSYALLTRSEQLLMGRLSVFSGGWELEAAEAVCSGKGLDARQIPDILASLVDKSLVVFEACDGAADGRYRLLETVRQYAAERLDQDGGTAALRASHQDYFLALAERAEPLLTGADQAAQLARLAAEHENLHTAFVGCGAAGESAETGLRLAGALWRFWLLRGHFGEGRAFLAEALACPGANKHRAEQAKALKAAGTLAFYQDDLEAARPLTEEALSIFRELADRQGIAWSLSDLGRWANAQGDPAAARTLYEEALAIFREEGHKRGTAWSLNHLGDMAFYQGGYGTALALYTEALAIFRELADRRSVGWSLHQFGRFVLEQGDPAAARALYEEGLTVFRELVDRQGITWSLYHLGRVMFYQGDSVAAQTLCGEALTSFREMSDRRGSAWSLNLLGDIAGAQDDPRTAYTRYAEALAIFRELEDRKGTAATLNGLAAALVPWSAHEAARLWGAAQTLRESVGFSQPPNEWERYEKQVCQARAALGEESFTVAWNEGRPLTWKEIEKICFPASPDPQGGEAVLFENHRRAGAAGE